MSEDLSYTRDEILSYLPMGWALDESRPRGWEAQRGRWRASLVDLAEQSWELSVSAAEADELGRGPALQGAIRRLLRKALGRSSLFG